MPRVRARALLGSVDLPRVGVEFDVAGTCAGEVDHGDRVGHALNSWDVMSHPSRRLWRGCA